MANTLEDLYFKYIDGVGKTMEDDRYFQYLYAMVQAGSNVLQQKHQVLNKVVDERWISIIEDSLDAINNIIDKPRRFITTSEEVVPVSLAKKITADSVRHLSMNTQFIASTEDGDIQPTKILNVTTEESYDLYENRFIYHLIYRLIAFVDKRTDVIFWSTGNETSNTLCMESSVDDAYEQINYKVQMTIKNTQSLVENDNDNMQVFMRIDRIRRLVFALRNSAFFSIMSGCSKVQSPIQRTNLMMKDPNYRTCYKLWQFLESYDDVGYTIEPIDSTLEFDEEYMIQMYTNMIANYTVFKSILELDERNIKELEKKERKPVKPKFIKEIKEEFVENRDLPDVEIRKVFVEEVTQAQLDAEAKLEEMTKRYEEEVKNREEAEEAESEAQRQIQELCQQLNTAMGQQIAVEDELEHVIQEKERQKEELEGQLREQKEQYEEQINGMKQEYETQLGDMRQSYEDQLSDMARSYDIQVSGINQSHEAAVSDMKQDYETQFGDMKQSYEGQLSCMKQGYESQLSDMVKSHDAATGSMRTDYETQLVDTKQQYETQIADMIEKQEADISGMNKCHAEEMAELRQDYELRLGEQKNEYKEKLDNLRRQDESQLLESTEKYETQLTSMEQSYETQLSSMKQEYESQLTNTRQSSKSRIECSEKEHSEQLADIRKKYENSQQLTINQLTSNFKERMKKLEDEKEQAVLAGKEAESRLKKAEKARKKAEERAEGTRLSRYIISSFSGKDKKGNQAGKEEDNGNKDEK